MFPVAAGCRRRSYHVLFLCCKDFFYVHHDHHVLHQLPYTKANWAYYALLGQSSYHSIAHLNAAEDLVSDNYWQCNFSHPHYHHDTSPVHQDQQWAMLGSCDDKTHIHNAYHDGVCSPQLLRKQELPPHHHTLDNTSPVVQNVRGGKLASYKDRASVCNVYHDGICSPQMLCKQELHIHHRNEVMDASHYLQGKLASSTKGTCLRYDGTSRHEIFCQQEGHHVHNHEPEDTSHFLQGKLGSCTNRTGARHGYHDGEHSLESLCEQGQLNKALDVLFHLNRAPSTKAYVCLLQACNRSKKDLPHAKQIHTHMVHYNVPLTAFLGDYLAMTLAKCGAVEDACRIADNLPHCSVLTWTAIIFAYTECGQAHDAIRLHQRMHEAGVKPNSYTYVSLFKACGCILDIDLGKKFHAKARAQGLASHVFVGSTLVSMYGKCGAIAEAEDVFASLQQRDLVSWNAMLTAYVEQNRGEKALRLFRQMQEEAVIINHSTIIFGLQACGILADIEDALVVDGSSTMMLLREVGQSLHAEARKKGLAFNVMIGSALVSMYGKCGTLLEADNAFTSLLQRDAVSWNAMLSSYIEQGNEEKGVHFYKQMQEDGLVPDETTFVLIFRACGNIAEKDTQFVVGQSNKVTILELGQALHADARRLGYASDTKVANTLVSMYGKCRAVSEAEEVFSGLSCPDVVSWTVLLSTYAEQGYAEKALELYSEMQLQHVTKDEVALVSALQACGATGSMETCRHLHYEIVSAGFDQDIAIVTTALISYRSCAIIADAQACFDGLSQPTIVLWNACMAGHAGEGSHIASLAMFENMKASNIKPNELTFISALSACRHTGLVGPSVEYFESMSRDYHINPNTKHYGTVLDLLGRVGSLEKVKRILERMPLQADVSIWLSLLGACGTHCNSELAKWAFDHAVKVDPKHAGAYIILSNICHDAGPQDFIAEMEFCKVLQGERDWDWARNTSCLW